MPRDDRTYRFLVAELASRAAGRLELPADEAHHARDVLRVHVGRHVEVFDGRGSVASGRIIEVDRRCVAVEIDSVERAHPAGPAVHLAFAAPKAKRLHRLLEQATELGVRSLQAVVFERSVAGGETLSDAVRQRWRARCISAAKQCGLNLLPEILPHATLAAYLDDIKGHAALLGDIGAEARPAGAVLAELPGGWDEIRILVGPEGGLTASERAAAFAAGLRPVRIGWTTLRIETAAVALLAAVTAVGD